MAVFCYGIIIVNLKVFVFSYTNTVGSILLIFGSIIVYILTYMFISTFTNKLDISHTFLYLFYNI